MRSGEPASIDDDHGSAAAVFLAELVVTNLGNDLGDRANA
jgi:hypothetical protein